MIIALLQSAAAQWVIDGPDIAFVEVPLAVPAAYPNIQLALRADGTAFFIWEEVVPNATRTELWGKKLSAAGIWSGTVALDDEDLDTTSPENIQPASLLPTAGTPTWGTPVSYVRRTRTACPTSCGLSLRQIYLADSLTAWTAPPGSPLALSVQTCVRVGLNQLLVESTFPAPRYVTTWVRQGLLDECVDENDPTWEQLDDLIANWNDAAAPYGTINKWDVANDPTGVQDGEHHVSGTILGQDRSIAQVHDDWVTNPNSVAFVGWNRNAAGP